MREKLLFCLILIPWRWRKREEEEAGELLKGWVLYSVELLHLMPILLKWCLDVICCLGSSWTGKLGTQAEPWSKRSYKHIISLIQPERMISGSEYKRVQSWDQGQEEGAGRATIFFSFFSSFFPCSLPTLKRPLFLLCVPYVFFRWVGENFKKLSINCSN